MAAAGAPLRFIEEWMGHSNAQTTEIYADYAPDPTQGAKYAEAAFGAGAQEDGLEQLGSPNPDPGHRPA